MLRVALDLKHDVISRFIYLLLAVGDLRAGITGWLYPVIICFYHLRSVCFHSTFSIQTNWDWSKLSLSSCDSFEATCLSWHSEDVELKPDASICAHQVTNSRNICLSNKCLEWQLKATRRILDARLIRALIGWRRAALAVVIGVWAAVD